MFATHAEPKLGFVLVAPTGLASASALAKLNGNSPLAEPSGLRIQSGLSACARFVAKFEAPTRTVGPSGLAAAALSAQSRGVMSKAATG